MKAALALVLALATYPALPTAAQAQTAAGPGPMMSVGASPSRSGDHRRGERHRRTDPVTRWERGLEQARARGNVTGREPWNTFQRAPATGFHSNAFPRSRLAGSQLWPGACWGWRSDCDIGGGVYFSAAPAVASKFSAAPQAAASPAPAFAPPAVRRLDSRPVVRGADPGARPTYAHRVWRP